MILAGIDEAGYGPLLGPLVGPLVGRGDRVVAVVVSGSPCLPPCLPVADAAGRFAVVVADWKSEYVSGMNGP